MSHKRSARLRRNPAQSLVEFALVVPLFFVMVLAMIDFGLGVYAYNNVAYAAQEGMRRGIVLGKDCGAYSVDGNKQNIATGQTPNYFNDNLNGVPANQSGQQTFTTAAITSPVVCPANATARPTIIGAVNNAAGALDRANLRVVIQQAPGGTTGMALPATSETVTVRVMYRHQPIWGFLLEGLANFTQANFDLVLESSATGRIQ